MIFFKKLQEQLNSLTQSLEQLHLALADTRVATEEVNQAVKKSNSDIGKHDMALEDMLEILGGKLESERFMSDRIRELEQSEGKLLLLMVDYEEQLFLIDGYAKNIKNASGTDDAWVNQLDSVREKLLQHMSDCGIFIIAEAHQRVNYECHEVIQVVDTDEAALSRVISEVYSPGFIYKGKVLKRAKVAAYRLTAPDTKQ